ncbi:MAG: DUF4124 domain-containing protein [Terriglobales bacterium]
MTEFKGSGSAGVENGRGPGSKVMSRITAVLLAASIAALLGGAGIARADQHVVYEWTDAHGQVHYTDQWVPGAKLIKVQTAPATTDSGAVQGIQSESNAASGEAKQEEESEAVQKDEDTARATQCAQAKAQYKSLIDSRRVYTVDKSGERHYLSDNQADAARVQAREAMQAACGS